MEVVRSYQVDYFWAGCHRKDGRINADAVSNLGCSSRRRRRATRATSDLLSGACVGERQAMAMGMEVEGWKHEGGPATTDNSDESRAGVVQCDLMIWMVLNS